LGELLTGHWKLILFRFPERDAQKAADMRPYLMIIDDSEDQIELMRAVFNMSDPSLEILSAQDGDEALNILRSRPNRLPKVI